MSYRFRDDIRYGKSTDSDRVNAPEVKLSVSGTISW